MSNKYYIIKPTANQTINIPIEINWDFLGRTDSIELYEDEVIREVLGVGEDFEISKFSHEPYGNNEQTKINYKFYFYNSPSPVPVSSTDWDNTYLFTNAIPSGFNASQVYYYQRPFTNSFFKLDFYDSPTTQGQTNYFTIIIPVQQGDTELASISPLIPPVKIKKPDFFLDFVGDKEGFFIYWLKSTSFIDINKFYMTAKFFDARIGVFVKMMNVPQASLLPANQFTFNGEEYFYYTVELDYDKKTYVVKDYLGTRIGTGTPINWYEYVNS